MLDERTVALMKGMRKRGDPLHDIGVYFGVPGARVCEVCRGKIVKWRGVAAAPAGELPEPGPYRVVSVIRYERQAAQAEVARLAIERLEAVIADLRKEMQHDYQVAAADDPGSGVGNVPYPYQQEGAIRGPDRTGQGERLLS